MPQFETATFLGQLFWLSIFSLQIFLAFYFVILPRYMRNMNHRQQILHTLAEGIEKNNRVVAELNQRVLAIQDEAERAAKERFNKVRHELDTEDQAIRESIIAQQRVQWQETKLANQIDDQELLGIVTAVKSHLSSCLSKTTGLPPHKEHKP